ncbi:MAG: hypothetical protein ACMUEL_01980 [Flavobacteriales bacterium Tduv]
MLAELDNFCLRILLWVYILVYLLYIFCNEILAKKAYEILLKKINKALEKNQEIVKTGVIIFMIVTVILLPKGTSYLRSRRIERKRGKSNQSKKRKGKKRFNQE